jgi:hypothetical protein
MDTDGHRSKRPKATAGGRLSRDEMGRPCVAGRTARWRVGSKSRRSARDGRTPRRCATARLMANAPASSECGGPPPLWHTASFLTQAIMVCSFGPYLCASRETSAYSRARGKSICPLVGKIRSGPQLQRTGTLQDAGAFHNRPFGRAALRRVGVATRGRLSRGEMGRPCVAGRMAR